MSSTICSEKIQRRPRSLESSNQRARDTRTQHFSVREKKEPVLPHAAVYFLKYLCLISASVTCPVQCAADMFWQAREASGQHRRQQAAQWIIDGINQHLWCGWQRAAAAAAAAGALRAAGPEPSSPSLHSTEPANIQPKANMLKLSPKASCVISASSESSSGLWSDWPGHHSRCLVKHTRFPEQHRTLQTAKERIGMSWCFCLSPHYSLSDHIIS